MSATRPFRQPLIPGRRIGLAGFGGRRLRRPLRNGDQRRAERALTDDIAGLDHLGHVAGRHLGGLDLVHRLMHGRVELLALGRNRLDAEFLQGLLEAARSPRRLR